MSDVTPAIHVDGVSKHFRIPRQQELTLRGKLLHPFRPTLVDEFTALDDISVDIAKGEFFGLVGRNGSGKSTLLKVIAGIYAHDTGEVAVEGLIAPFIELGVGFNEDLSARDNVFINGAILGLSRRDLVDRFDAIVEFAELEGFMEMKLRNFSSGMLLRLAFGIAVQSGAEVLLIDEVLAVGDEKFQRKCFDVFRERKERGETVVFVSHDMTAVQSFCDRVLLLDKGKPVALGTPSEVVPLYHELNGEYEQERTTALRYGRDGAPARIVDVRVAGTSTVPVGEATTSETVSVPGGGSFDLEVDVEFVRGVQRPSLRCVITRHGGAPVTVLGTELATGAAEAGTTMTARFRATNVLAPDRYGLFVELVETIEGQEPLAVFVQPDAGTVVVEGTPNGGVVDLPLEVEVLRTDGQALATSGAGSTAP